MRSRLQQNPGSDDMASTPRRDLIDESVVGIYHCTARCVRRAFLCGQDPYSGIDYSHRKTWIRDRLVQLAAIMAVEPSFYAAMDNHIHVLLRNRPDLVERWSDEEVLRRACRLFVYKFEQLGVEDQEPTDEQLRQFTQDQKLVQEMRARLSSISWLMKCLCERIAKRCNEEDGVTGHFFEGRFSSKRILDEAGIIICGVYVDLNKVRAGIARLPEDSEFTSAFDRIQGRAARQKGASPEVASRFDGWLTPIQVEGDGQQYPAGQRASDKGVLSMSLDDYLELLDWTARELRAEQGGAIPGGLPAILERLGLQERAWLACIRDFQSLFKTAIGSASSLARHAQRLGHRWLHGSRRVEAVLTGSGGELVSAIGYVAAAAPTPECSSPVLRQRVFGSWESPLGQGRGLPRRPLPPRVTHFSQ